MSDQRARPGTILNRTQLLVLGFFVLVWIALVVILVVSPDVYAQSLRLAPSDGRTNEALFLVALTALIALLVLGVLRRWRWAFWLILVAFFFGVLRLPASILQLIGMMPATGPLGTRRSRAPSASPSFWLRWRCFRATGRPARGESSDHDFGGAGVAKARATLPPSRERGHGAAWLSRSGLVQQRRWQTTARDGIQRHAANSRRHF